MKINKIIASSAAILFVIFGLLMIGTTSVEAQEAPNFTLTDLNGEKVSLSDFKGKVIIVDFWATWCGPCKMEIPSFIQLQEKYQDDVVILGISLDQGGPKTVVPFAKKMNINYPIVYGDGSVVQAYGGVRGIPTTFVIDRDFNIQRKYVGYTDHKVFEKDILAFK
ncbi:MAG: TlpA family protein disulfide reductase [Candidatus Marinimicrobia bacterium]|nr:TlpA family protein disulfide reductase [Candidatus Neomarinimicrobiota bacterium]